MASPDCCGGCWAESLPSGSRTRRCSAGAITTGMVRDLPAERIDTGMAW